MPWLAAVWTTATPFFITQKRQILLEFKELKILCVALHAN